MVIALEPKTDEVALATVIIDEAAASMHKSVVVEDLKIASLELEFNGVLLGNEMYHVQCLRLNFSHCRDTGEMWAEVRACQWATGIGKSWSVPWEIMK